MKKVEVRINHQDEIPHAAATVQQFGVENELTPAVIHDLNVVVDEALNNVISYGYDGNDRSDITLRVERRPGEVIIMIEDWGRPFDPLKAPIPNLTRSLQARQIGGLGIHFMRSLMDEVSYARVGNVNRLQLTKKITT